MAIFKYKTKQREAILNYLRQNHEPMTGMQLAAVLAKKKFTGQFDYLLSSSGGLISWRTGREIFLPNEKSAYYRYVPEQENIEVHFHLKCTACGRLEHMTCDRTVEITQHIFNEHGFQVDFEMTFIYGLCKYCQSRRTEK